MEAIRTCAVCWAVKSNEGTNRVLNNILLWHTTTTTNAWACSKEHEVELAAAILKFEGTAALLRNESA